MMDVIGYVRVSTAEQASSGLGLAAQQKAIQDACSARQWGLAGFHEDAGVSGRGVRRPGLDAALNALANGDAQGLIVAKVDRLSRSVSDFAALMVRAGKEGWSIVALDVGVDTTTPNGKFVANVMASFAELERDLIGQRTKEALAVRRSQGVQLGRPPTMDQATVRRIVRFRTRGHTYAAIAALFNEEGVPTAQGGSGWHAQTVRKAFLRARR